MELLQTVLLTVVLYLSVILLLSLIRAFFALRKGVSSAKQTFVGTFGAFFLELVNPLNWI